VKISNRERVIFPESGQTKGQLAEYYTALAPLMLAHMSGRPVSLVRCPQGCAKKCFFQKHDSGSLGPHVHHVPIRERDGGHEDYMYVDSAAGILTCVQMGTIEFHGWASHASDVEAPDRMTFDLDPDEGLDFSVITQAALDLRDKLSGLGLTTFAMLSGGKGIHIIAPLTSGHSWDEHKDFSRRFAEAMSIAEPDRFVATISKARRKGKILIDYLRNQRGSTAVMPYSARARAGAPVAAPVTWDELRDISCAYRWSIDDASTLIGRANGKELKGWGFATQTLPGI
jgi:bifunctional non-homologous end joining protein LigD